MSVLRLMRALVKRGWEVDLVLTTGGGNLESSVDSAVTIRHLRSRSAGNAFLQANGLLGKLRQLPDLLLYAIYRIQGFICSAGFRFRQYDAAVVSLHGLSARFCCKWVRAGKRIQWIRNDLLQCDKSGKAKTNINTHKGCIDYYICVSETAHASLLKLFPGLKDKALVLYNIINAENMRALAKASDNPYNHYSKHLKVVTVCRLLNQAKGLFRMLAIHTRLHTAGLRFYWFVVGDGPDRKALQQKINQAGLGEYFILLGHRKNPFPYYKFADIAATLSYYEGLCGTVNEAKVLGKPVIATQFSGINEQLTNNENGLIVENNEEAIYCGLQRLLTDTELRGELSNTSYPVEILDDDYKLDRFENLIQKGSSI